MSNPYISDFQPIPGNLYKIIEKRNFFTHYDPDPSNRESILPSRQIYGFNEDDSGNILVASFGTGLSKLDPSSHTFKHYVPRIPPEILDQVDPTNTIRHHLPQPSAPTSINSPGTMDILKDQEGFQWIALFEGGVDRFDPTTERFTHYPLKPDSSVSDHQRQTISLSLDPSGAIWAGTWSQDLIRFDPQTGESSFYPFGKGLIGDVRFDGEENIWLSTSAGIYRFNPETEAFTFEPKYGSENGGLKKDIEGRLWRIYTQGGVEQLDASGAVLHRYTTEDGLLPSTNIACIVDDLEGNLWFSGNTGLSRLNPENGIIHNFDQSHGLTEYPFSSSPSACFRTENGRLYFGRQPGITSFHPDDFQFNTAPPQIAITDFKVETSSTELVTQQDAEDNYLLDEPITLAHNQSDFTISYAGLHFEDPEKTTYQYRLAGMNENWVQAENDRVARYFQVPPGEYTFEVKATSLHGISSVENAAMSITILPPWWQTSFAFVVYGLSFVVGFISIDRFRRQRLIAKERQQTELREAELKAEAAQALSREATAIAREKESEAKALQSENKRKELEIEKGKELEKSYRELQQALAHLRETQDQLVHTEKLASLGQLTAGIAHEIKNPLNFVNNFSRLSKDIMEELEEWIQEHNIQPDEDLEDIIGTLKMNVAKIHHHGNRADGIVKSMLEHSRTEPGQRRAADVNKLLDEYVNLAFHSWQATHEEKHVPKVTREYDGSIGQINLIPQNIGRVLINLLDNAFYAVGEKSEALSPGPEGLQAKHPADFEPRTSDYLPEVKVSTSRDAEYIEIRIQDNGVGIPKDIQSKIFEPFFTTKPTGSGTGLGLSLSYDIVVQGHKGKLFVESEDGEGATFIIRLPV